MAELVDAQREVAVGEIRGSVLRPHHLKARCSERGPKLLVHKGRDLLIMYKQYLSTLIELGGSHHFLCTRSSRMSVAQCVLQAYLLVLSLLATVALPEYLTILIFFLALVMASPSQVVFSGFLQSRLSVRRYDIGSGNRGHGLRRLAGLIERLFSQSYLHLVAAQFL